MKKKVFLAAVAVCGAAVSIFAFNGAGDDNALLMQNIESLARNESQDYHICYYESTVQVGRTYYDCGSCEKVQDEKGKGSYTKCYPK